MSKQLSDKLGMFCHRSEFYLSVKQSVNIFLMVGTTTDAAGRSTTEESKKFKTNKDRRQDSLTSRGAPIKTF